jgi:acyl-CoA synthetase (NDP forming)
VTSKRLKEIYPSFWHPGNPLDAWGTGWDPKRLAKTLEIVAEDPAVGVIVMVLMPQSFRRVGVEVAKVVRTVAERSPVAFALLSDSSGGPREPGIMKLLEGSNVPYVSGLRYGLTAIAKWLHSAPPQTYSENLCARGSEAYASFVAEFASIDEARRFAFFRSIDVPMAACVTVESAPDAANLAQKLGLPVVMKGCAPDIVHKSEHGLVALNLATTSDVERAFDSVSLQLERASQSPHRSIVVQNQVRNGVEIIVGIRNFPGFGSLLVVGPGGVLVDLLKQKSVRLGPVDERTARDMLDETSVGTLLRGFRGERPFDLGAAAKAIVAMSQFGAATVDSIASVEINPLIVGRTGAVAVDLVIEPFATTSP